MMPRNPRASWAVVAGGAVLATLFASPGASAADDMLLISEDGIHFVAAPTFTLFDEVERVVPSDRLAATVWLRNSGSEPGTVRLDIMDVTTDDPLFAAAVVVALGAPGAVYSAAPSAAQVISEGGCAVLSDGATLAPGETMRVSAELVVDPRLSGRDGVEAELGFHLRAILSDSIVALPETAVRPCTSVSPPVVVPSDAAADPLPVTGLQISAESVFFAIAGMVLGAAALFGANVQRRRRDQRADNRSC